MGEVRIISGQWRRSKLAVPDLPGLRPTPDRVRETLFNWLGQDLTGWQVLDAFSGSGALGFEAASRGATQVLLIEQDPGLVRALQASAQRLQANAVTVRRGDGLAAMRAQAPASMDLIFLDPPFAADLFSAALSAARSTVRAGGWVYLEAHKAWGQAEVDALGFSIYRQLRAGQVWAHLLQPA
ncbi:MAG: 16S rRNA (guanine(966)-N(2))-methyltransferase RsmD [Alphaproteobacteria bacterium]|nr:16S rRNA (guanine(966)-N(2))-methyltransferase RsmD [Alphaproteobacteria bacterium]